MRALFVVQLAMCMTGRADAVSNGRDPWNRADIFEPNVHFHWGSQFQVCVVELECPARPLLFIAETDTAPWDINNEMADDHEDSEWIAPVKVYSFQAPDMYYPIWLRSNMKA